MNLYPENTTRLWFQFPFHLTNATSYEEGQLICWEPGKHNLWMRPKVPYSIQHIPWDREKQTVRDKNKGFGFYDVLENFQASRPHTAFLVGLRATESMNRFRAVAKNPGYKDCFGAPRLRGRRAAPLFTRFTIGIFTTFGNTFTTIKSIIAKFTITSTKRGCIRRKSGYHPLCMKILPGTGGAARV